MSSPSTSPRALPRPRQGSARHARRCVGPSPCGSIGAGLLLARLPPAFQAAKNPNGLVGGEDSADAKAGQGGLGDVKDHGMEGD